MNNRYFGNIHDFCKYGLLRQLAQGFRLGVCWMLTPLGERSNRGYEYLSPNNPDNRVQKCDTKLFQGLLGLHGQWKEGNFSEWGVNLAKELIPDAEFFGSKNHIPKSMRDRDNYFRKMIGQFQSRGLDLIFLDPDFGLGFMRHELTGKRGGGYLRASEVVACFEQGFSVLFYQDWYPDFGEDDPARKIRGALRSAGVCAPLFCFAAKPALETQSSKDTGPASARFFLVPQDEHLERVNKFVDRFRSMGWCNKGYFEVFLPQIGVFIDVDNAAGFGLEFAKCAYEEAVSFGDPQIVAVAKGAKKSQEQTRAFREFLSGKGVKPQFVSGEKNKGDFVLSAAAIEMTTQNEIDQIVVISDDGLFRANAEWARKNKIRYVGIGKNPRKGYPGECDEFGRVSQDRNGPRIDWDRRGEG